MILDGLLFRYLDVWESGVNQISTKLMTPKEFVNGKVIVTADWTHEIFYVGPPEYRLETLEMQGGGVFNNISRFSAFTGLFFSRLADKLNRWIDLPVDTNFWRSARAVPLANGITAQPIMANDRRRAIRSVSITSSDIKKDLTAKILPDWLLVRLGVPRIRERLVLPLNRLMLIVEIINNLILNRLF
ncbi:unnamed protein product [Rhizophagus irregularis]|uniref:Uncharacterized protein n=1 Tax=Rhizophagus irregularis TaxID=588596 RepID=A0A916E404_9GLOM|nr:unnamed protein product [Rhizophagus irregularis]